MISEELKLIVDKFNEQGKMNFLEETTEEKISEFEIERSIKLPTKFKEWLLFSDGGEFFLPAGIQLYGIKNKNLFRKVKEQESGLQNSSKIFLKKAKLMMTMALHFKVSI